LKSAEEKLKRKRKMKPNEIKNSNENWKIRNQLN